MILPFNESYFVVTFTGECPQSTLVKGWEGVLDHIDDELGNKDERMPPEASVRSPCCELHDEDNWTTLGHCYVNNDDERHTFSKNEFAYCVGLHIVRLTEPVAIKPQPWKPTPGTTHLERCERCDGCGWYEGGPTIQTPCEVCNATGVVRISDASSI